MPDAVALLRQVYDTFDWEGDPNAAHNLWTYYKFPDLQEVREALGIEHDGGS